MNKIKRLIQSYGKFISIPWREGIAPAQRVIFCVYDESDERHLRANICEFEIETNKAGHDWALFDLTSTFANWLTGQRYAKKYFQQPELLSILMPRYKQYIRKEFENFLLETESNDNLVVAVYGTGSLFGFLKVKDVVDDLAPLVNGRLLVLFPGSYYENNNYRLFDAYDGWNYLATLITADKSF
jgi:hypothetical protein